MTLFDAINAVETAQTDLGTATSADTAAAEVVTAAEQKLTNAKDAKAVTNAARVDKAKAFNASLKALVEAATAAQVPEE